MRVGVVLQVLLTIYKATGDRARAMCGHRSHPGWETQLAVKAFGKN